MTPPDRVRICGKCGGYHECQCVLERVAEALERIATCLEHPPVTMNYSTTGPSPAPATIIGSYGGYQCAGCSKWVRAGESHSCTGFIGGAMGSTATIDPTRCNYVTAANMQCLLDLGHLGGHELGI